MWYRFLSDLLLYINLVFGEIKSVLSLKHIEILPFYLSDSIELLPLITYISL